ncbi:hypothetical protein FP744_10005778 [Trichoderma asperellum]|nr:hypothetical protein LI328DRAFT_142275 [Trichoderma asperelloides]
MSGITGFGFQCLSSCIEGFQLISTAFQVGKHAVHYRCAILLEEERLLLWAKRSGLADNHLDPRLNEAIINQVLAALQDILISTNKLSKRNKLDVVVSGPPENGTSHNASLSEQDLSFLQSGALSNERELLHDIRELIQGLYDLLSLNVQDDILQHLQIQRSEMLRATSQLSDLRVLIEAADDGDKSHDKELQDLMNEATQSKHASLTPLFTRRVSETKLIAPGGHHGSILYGGKTHYVEWKSYDWNSSKESRDRILDSIVNLAMLLNAPKHPVFRTLDCVVIIDEPIKSRYMYVYRWPVESESPPAPRTLHELLSSTFKPSLTDRFALSHQLSRALFYMHLANWMHKSFSSYNVLFFPESSDSPRPLNDPYIVGFSYARPDAAGHPSEKLDRDPGCDIYRHPDCLEEGYAGFHKAYDVYRLGLVLYEIVKWRHLKETFLRTARAEALKARKKNGKELTKQELCNLDAALLKECKVQDIKAMRKRLLDPAINTDLAFRAASNLAKVVLTCLGAEVDEIQRSDDNNVLYKTFFESVWKPLERFEI